jgi:hypothetical protein
MELPKRPLGCMLINTPGAIQFQAKYIGIADTIANATLKQILMNASKYSNPNIVISPF